ncbi:tyrosine-protein phosphatase [Gulosibacter massiliensis]|uniref:tyrosine-protein phosphatase n=1 Tax=Gulosibacter massiliensis TaxID=2479839 RepID=UPI000F63FB35|nr:tyrosine-protein phosphatase [Gulosibacter massiliensis]
MARERDWPGAFNTRDLGGIPVAAGVLAPGVLFRSGQPQTWGSKAWARAEAEGVRRVLDLRDPSEPRGSAEGTEAIEYRFAPVEDPILPAFRERFDPYLNHPSGYADFVGFFSERIAGAVGELLEAGPGTLVCCSAGRDRTGLVMGILLLRLGADAEVLVHEDELAVRAVNEHHLHREKPHPYERWHDEPELAEIIRSRGDAVREFAADFDAHDFLRAHGVSDAAVERACDWLIAPR